MSRRRVPPQELADDSCNMFDSGLISPTDTSYRLPTPEPHVPLRKASPHRLRTRRAVPHPLFFTAHTGTRGFGPATASTAAVPYHTNVTASRQRSASGQSGKENAESIPDSLAAFTEKEGKSEDSWPGTTGTLQWDLPAAQPARNGSLPVLRSSRSMTDGLRNVRERLNSIQQDTTPSLPGPDTSKDDARISMRSGLTSSSSFMDSTVSTGRSSMATPQSLAGEFITILPPESEVQDEGLTVEDAIGMYADGFGSPMKQSFDTSRFVGAPLNRPTSSLYTTSERFPGRRRSQSATFLRTPDASGFLVSGSPEERPHHFRTATQMITGRDRATGTSQRAMLAVPRDRYGFKKASQYISLDKYESWEGPYGDWLARRTGKWTTLMKKYGLSTEKPTRFPPKSDQVKRYVRKGIPPNWRGAAWFWYAGGPGLQKQNEGLYWTLLDKIRHGSALNDNDREHIERDLNRTYPDNIKFKPDPKPGEGVSGPDGVEMPIVRALRRVLQAFAVHNPNIGYCQSLNFIAGLLLIFLDDDEEKTFTLLNVITNEYLPGTHGISLEGANIDIGVLMTSVNESLPGIWTKINDEPANSVAGGPPRLPTVSLATTAWFMSLFVGTLPIECVLRVWDCLFYEGSKTLFRVALGIFKAGEAQINAVSDHVEVFQVVQGLPRGMIDANALMETCFKRRNGFGALTQDVVEERREERRREVREGKCLTVESGKKKVMVMRMKSRGRFRSKSVKKL